MTATQTGIILRYRSPRPAYLTVRQQRWLASLGITTVFFMPENGRDRLTAIDPVLLNRQETP